VICTPRFPTRSRSILAVALGSLVVAACGGGGEAEPTTTTAASTTTSSTTTTTSTTTTMVSTTTSTTTTTSAAPQFRAPLTGQPLASAAEIPARPALVVKIDNHPQARPQSGLNEADIVFEENVEDLTRFAAVFHSQGADPVGPIRSGRTQDIDLLGSFDRPLFAWSGGNDGVTAAVKRSDLVNLDGRYTPGYFRVPSPGIDREHTLYSTTEDLWANTPEGRVEPPPQQFRYVDDPAQVPGERAAGVDVAMDNVAVSWSWDAASSTYLREMGGQPHEDRLSGQVSTNNVVVLVVQYRPSPVVASSPDAQTVGTGEVWVLAGGKVQHGTWSRAQRTDVFALTADDGSPMLLVPGRTFVELARSGRTTIVT
jgi:hypothetical protein